MNLGSGGGGTGGGSGGLSRNERAAPARSCRDKLTLQGPRCLLVTGRSGTLLVSWVRRLGRKMGEMLWRKMRGSRAGRTARHFGEEKAVFERFQSRNRKFWSKDFCGHEASYRGGRWQRLACDCVANSEGGVAAHKRWHCVGRNSKVPTSSAAGALAAQKCGE
jgi:hypothetical protein